MKSIKTKIAAPIVAFSILVAGVAAPTQQAHAGVIIAACVPGMISAVVGLFMAGAGFFWGIQSEGLNVGAAALFVLDEKGATHHIAQGLAQKYPQLDSYVIDEIAQIVASKGVALQADAQGMKEVILTEEELAPVLEPIALWNPKMAEELRTDLTRSAL